MWVQIAIGGCLAVMGGLLSVLNFYLYFLRYPLYLLGGGKAEKYRYISGIPVFGSLLLWVAAPLLYSQPALMWTALVVSLFDMAGLHMFPVAMLLAVLWPSKPRD